jgi:ATP-dependent DNA helicase RecQ
MRVLLGVLRGDDLPAIVYAATRGSVELVARRLARAGVRATGYHAGLPDRKRREAQDGFMRGDIPVIVATNAFGMGIDKSNVRLVAHYAMSGTLEAYYQEAGRAGRDGKPSRCLLLYHPGDRRTYEHFIAQAHPPRTIVERVFAAICSTAYEGRVPLESIVRSACGKMSADQYAGAFAVLARHGVLEPAQDDLTVRIRLLATPMRIGRELSADADARELALLRTLWRRSVRGAYDAFEVPLTELGGDSARTVRTRLEDLRARQFLDMQPIDSGLRIARPGVPLDALLDWDGLARRRAHEMSKLGAMEDYARTRACRRAFVLRYFGDVASVRRGTSSRCTGCDNCLGKSLRLPGATWRH